MRFRQTRGQGYTAFSCGRSTGPTPRVPAYPWWYGRRRALWLALAFSCSRAHRHGPHTTGGVAAAITETMKWVVRGYPTQVAPRASHFGRASVGSSSVYLVTPRGYTLSARTHGDNSRCRSIGP